MAGFNSVGENFDRIFLTDYQIIDRFVGNRTFAWGVNNHGQLGDGTTVNKSSPIEVSGVGNTWAQISAGSSSVPGTPSGIVAAIKTDGTLWTWGYNNNGELGIGTKSNRSSPGTVTSTTDWKQVSAGPNFMAAIKTDGTLWTWGYNASGQLGNSTSITRSSPSTTALGGYFWKQVACGGVYAAATATGFTIGLGNDGRIWTWGTNGNGELGQNSNIASAFPNGVVDPLGVDYNWNFVAAGGSHSAAIKTDGSLWMWGSGSTGQLGNGTTVTRSTPVSVLGGNTIKWRYVACGHAHTAGIKVDGTLWTWGFNSTGQLGTGDTASKSSPTTVTGGGTTWKQVSLAYNHSAAIKTDGTLWTWGRNTLGQLGNNTTVNSRSSPTTIAGGMNNWKQVTTSAYAESVGNGYIPTGGNTLGIAFFNG